MCFDLGWMAPTEQRLSMRAATPGPGLHRACPTTVRGDAAVLTDGGAALG